MKRRLFPLLVLCAAALAGSARAQDGRIDLETLQATAARGDAWSQAELASRYENADGVPRDFQAANLLFCKAARQGNADAQFKLGWIYANGRGVPRDEGAAYRLFVMAAEQGHRHAAELLEHVPRQTQAVLPACMFPDPPPIAAFVPYKGPSRALSPPGNARERAEIVQLVRTLAPRYSVDPQLALAVIAVESAFNPSAVSPRNAQGVMQLIPETAQRFGVKHAFDPAENVKGGLAYLRWLLAFFQGNVPLVAAAYNAGERAVEKHRGIPPYAETQQYVRKISLLYRKSTHPYEADVVQASPMMARVRPTKG